MKPKASLKSLNTNFFVMASRSLTSLQPDSFARALLRASPVSFWAMMQTSSSQNRPFRHGSRQAGRFTSCHSTDILPTRAADCIQRGQRKQKDVSAQLRVREEATELA